MIGGDNILRAPFPHDPSEIPVVPANRYLLKTLEQTISQTGDRVFLTDVTNGNSIRLAEVQKKVPLIASGLTKRSFGKGKVLCMYTSNIVEFHIVVLGAWECGGCVTTVDPQTETEDFVMQLKETKSNIIVCDENNVTRALEAAQLVETVSEVFVFGKAEGCTPVTRLTEDDGSACPKDVLQDMEDVIYIPYTSGTTGSLKAVQHTHRTVQATFYQNSHRVIDAEAVAMMPKRLSTCQRFHISGFLEGFTVLAKGMPSYAMSKYSVEILLQAVQKHQPSLLVLYPHQLTALAKHTVENKCCVSSVTHVITGGFPILPAVRLDVLKKMPNIKAIYQVYGLTETFTISTSTPYTFGDKKFTSISQSTGAFAENVGRLAPFNKLKVVDPETEKILSPMEEGEFYVITPSIMKGYLNRPEETRQRIDEDGWLHTGDLGYYDKEGYISIIGKKREVFKSRTGQTFPTTVLENIFMKHQGVSDAAIVGVSEGQCRNLPRAYIVKRKGYSVTTEDLINHVNSFDPDWEKSLVGIVFIDNIPRTKTGKIIREELK